MRFGFVILNYNTFNEAKQCVESIRSMRSVENSFEIVVVDNASTDNSARLLESEYGHCDDVRLLFADKNLGFSRGNNMGYKVVRDSCDFVVVTNSDTEFLDLDFMDKVEKAHRQYEFDVCGPDVFFVEDCGFGPCEYHQSPIGPLCVSESYINDRISEDERMIEFYRAGKEPFNRRIRRTFPPIRHFVRMIRDNRRKAGQIQHNVRLYGACIIVSRRFLDVYEKIFEPETFLYGEEEILGIKLWISSKKTLYDPSIRVRHYVSTATAALFNEREFEKQAQRLQEDINATRVIRSYYYECGLGEG